MSDILFFPWWVVKDVCDILGIINPSDTIKKLDQDEVDKIYITDPLGRKQETSLINESGLYKTIIRSNKPDAKPFIDWLTRTVLPSIRKTGSYSITKGKPISFVKVAKEFKAAASIAKIAGLKANQAILSANRATLKMTGYDCLDKRRLRIK